MKKILRRIAIIGIYAALGGCIISLPLLFSTDNFHFEHRLGKEIVTAHAVPVVDHLTWTMTGESVRYQSWLSAIVYCVSDKFAPQAPGFGAIILQALLIASGLFGILKLAGPPSVEKASAALLLVIFCHASLDQTGQLWMFGFYPWLYLAAQRDDKFSPVILFVVTVVLANVVTDSYLVSIMPIMLLVDCRGSKTNVGFRVAAILSGLLCSPVTYHNYVHWYELFSTHGLTARRLCGALSPDLHEEKFLIAGFTLTLPVLYYLSASSEKVSRIPLVATFLCFLFTPGAKILFAVHTALILASGFEYCSRALSIELRLMTLRKIIGLAVLLFVFMPHFLPVNGIREVLPTLGLLRDEFAAQSQKVSIMHDLRFAGALADAGIDTFIDYRAELFTGWHPEKTVTGSIAGDYDALFRGGDRWEEVLSHWQPDAVVLYADTSLTNILIEKKNWRILNHSEFHQDIVNGRVVDRTVAVLIPPA